MSKRRKLRIGILVAVVGVLVVSLVGVAWVYVTLRPLGEFFDQGLLGPEDQRQRVEVPAHGFVVSFADDWVVETPAPAPLVERVGMTAVLTSTAPEDGPLCTIYVAPGGVTTSAERLLKPWMAQHGDPGEYWTTGDESASGFAYQDDERSASAVWAIPHGDDALVLACVLPEDARNDSADRLWQDPGFLMQVGMPPIVGSIEVLPPSSPAPAPWAPGQGGRVEVPEAGFALTFPDGWTIIESTARDDEHAEALIPDRMLPWRSSPRVTGVRLSSGGPEAPVESCTLEDLTLAGYMGSWDDAPLESIVALRFPLEIQPEAFAVTYIDLPAGRVARVDSYDGQSNVSTYVLPHHKTLHSLICEGPERPGEDWDSIARSIELPSAET